MKMRLFDPELAKILENLDKEPIIPAFKSFADIVTAMRQTHEYLMLQKERFEKLYSEKSHSGKLTKSGLDDFRADFNDAFMPYMSFVRDAIRKEIENWKDREQKNVFAVTNKAPTDDQAKQLEVILKREKISKAELEMWAKNFGSNYLCASAFRDFAEKKGYQIIYSDFTDADDRLTDIENAYEYLNTMLSGIMQPEHSSYNLLAFYGTDENGNSYEGSLAAAYTKALDRDTTFKAQKIEVKPITEPKKEDDKEPGQNGENPSK